MMKHFQRPAREQEAATVASVASAEAGRGRMGGGARARMARARGALLAGRSRRRMLLALAGVVALSVALHVALMGMTTGAASDVEAYGIQARSVFAHQDVYVVTGRYPYPPVWIWIVALMQVVAQVTGWAFVFCVRLPALVGDVGITLLLYGYARERIGDCWLAVGVAALYALNPVTLLISAGHGQFDSLPLCCLLLAITVRGAQQQRATFVGALALGVAIALKGYPALLLPYFAVTAPRGKRLATVAVACVPVALSYAVYIAVFGVAPEMFTHVIGYRSTLDFGWFFVLFRSSALRGALPLDLWVVWGETMFVLVLFSFVLLAPQRLATMRPATAVALIFTFFYVTTMTMSAQYMLWVLPFLCLAAPLETLVYSAGALLALVPFYAQVSAARGGMPVWADPLWLREAPHIRVVGALALVAAAMWVFIRLADRRRGRGVDGAETADWPGAGAGRGRLTWRIGGKGAPGAKSLVD